MNKKVRKWSPTIFGLVIFCFLLPFVTFSCPGMQIKLTGVDTMIGTTIEGEHLEGDWRALFALLCAVAGLAAAFIKTRRGYIGSLIAGGAGATLLLLLKLKIDKDIMREGGGMIQVTYDFAFWLAFLAFAAAAMLNIHFLSEEGKGIEDANFPVMPTEQPAASGTSPDSDIRRL